jgi:transposase IS66-like protein
MIVFHHQCPPTSRSYSSSGRSSSGGATVSETGAIWAGGRAPEPTTLAIGRKNYRFAGSDAGGRRAAAICSLTESAKLNGLNPQHYLTDLLTRIADHPARRIAQLLP